MLRNTIKFIIKYPIRILNSMYSKYIYKNYTKRDHYIIHESDKGENIVVFAPHVDDETIGLGGTLLSLRENANNMILVYVTDGSSSTSHLDQSVLIKKRRDEGNKVGQFYGFDQVIFLDEKDGDVCANNDGLVESIIEIIELSMPNRIYTPFLIDGHRDHLETSKSVIFACERIGRDIDIYGYQINNPILPELINQVYPMNDEIIMEKDKAYRIFSSQYVLGFGAFNLIERRQGEFLIGEYAAEVFVKASSDKYMLMLKSLKNSGFYPEEFKQISSEYNLIPALRISRDKKLNYTKKLLEIMG